MTLRIITISTNRCASTTKPVHGFRHTCLIVRDYNTTALSNTLKPRSQRRHASTKVKTNPANVQLLSPVLHEQVFGAYTPKSRSRDAKERERLAQQHLTQQGIWGKKADKQEPIEFKIPSLYGSDIDEHFIRIGYEQAGPYLTISETLARVNLPKKPDKWSKKSGWTRYVNGKATAVEYPLEDALVFDVEVLVKDGHYPVMATAASSEAWYSWTSPYLSGESKTNDHLIPFRQAGNQLVVGHNVGYDRARIANEYSCVASGIRYLDTMSLHIAVSGICSQQRPAWIKRRKHDMMAAVASESEANEPVPADFMEATKFFDVSSLNSLKDVAKFHCKIDVDKTQRSLFESGTLADIRNNFQDMMRYCANDVELTHKIYRVVLPKFRDNCPHPVSFAGMLHMGNSFLTVNEKWDRYLANSVGKHQELTDLLDVKIRDLAEKARELVNDPEAWQKDPWLSQLDWTVNPRQRKLKGQPSWYKDAYDSKSGTLKISIRSRVAPLLLRLKWNGHPLHHITEHGWCYKVQLTEYDPSKISAKVVLQDDTYAYFKVPHKDGESANCGNPLAKNYMNAYEDKVLTSEYEAAKHALELNAKSAYWISSRERILNQFVVWDKNPCVDMKLPSRYTQVPNGKYGIILPQMVTMGTVTRRAVEKTWLTASNAKANRIGSELKSMVQAPEGYKLVGADVDSEELWIASVIGDAQFGFHGASALGWMTLQGTKSEGTDLHSKTASILGISRDKAKVFNYARIYGAGVKYATSLLMQYNQGMDIDTAKLRAEALYSSTKGDKEHSVRNRFERTFWHGGTESYMFNALEDTALSEQPRTPVLGCAITDALKREYTGTRFLTSRVNWVVQSSGVDYLHLLIVSMAHLIERYNINARFVLSVHDEVRYLSSESDQDRTAFALQVANLWTRALFSHKLGINNLPQSVAFFSAVDIDHVLRKEPNMTCTTPSHQEVIAEGKSCTVLETLQQLESQTGLSRTDFCLLGDEQRTPGLDIDQNTIQQTKLATKTSQGDRKSCSLEFLEAQMHKDYHANPYPAIGGGRETEEKMDDLINADDMIIVDKVEKVDKKAKEDKEDKVDKVAKRKAPQRKFAPASILRPINITTINIDDRFPAFTVQKSKSKSKA